MAKTDTYPESNQSPAPVKIAINMIPLTRHGGAGGDFHVNMAHVVALEQMFADTDKTMAAGTRVFTVDGGDFAVEENLGFFYSQGTE